MTCNILYIVENVNLTITTALSIGMRDSLLNPTAEGRAALREVMTESDKLFEEGSFYLAYLRLS